MENSHISELDPDIEGSIRVTLMLGKRSTPMSQVEKQKLQNHVPAALVRALDIEIRNGKDPTLQTLSDGITFCLEEGVKKLAEQNNSEKGRYIAELFSKLRQKELDDRVWDAERQLSGYQPRDYEQRPGNLRPIREENVDRAGER